MHSSQNGNGGSGYPRRNIDHTGLTQPPIDYSNFAQAPPGNSTLPTRPPIAPNYEAQRLTYAPRPNFGLPEQGGDYTAFTMPAAQGPVPQLRGQYLTQPATNNFHGNYAAYPPLRSGVSAYMPQQGAAESSAVRPAPSQPGIEIANGGVDLRRSLPSMGTVINNRDITSQFPDGTTKVVRTHGGVVTLRMAAKTVQKWYAQNTGRSGSLLTGFRVVNGVYIARIV